MWPSMSKCSVSKKHAGINAMPQHIWMMMDCYPHLKTEVHGQLEAIKVNVSAIVGECM